MFERCELGREEKLEKKINKKVMGQKLVISVL
jgi:hypothetical protein